MNAVADFGETGAIWFHQCRPGKKTLVKFDLKNLPPKSTRACHIHEFGDITQGCMTAGPHFNPYGEQHGSAFLDGKKRHAGDMINNITPDEKGEVRTEYWDDLLNLFSCDIVGDTSIIGRMVVIHDGVDDLGRGGTALSKENGSAGGRMKCAVIGRTGREIRHPKKEGAIERKE
jgi:superoxide dismutase, Cu-Zn family